MRSSYQLKPTVEKERYGQNTTTTKHSNRSIRSIVKQTSKNQGDSKIDQSLRVHSRQIPFEKPIFPSSTSNDLSNKRNRIIRTSGYSFRFLTGNGNLEIFSIRQIRFHQFPFKSGNIIKNISKQITRFKCSFKFFRSL